MTLQDTPADLLATGTARITQVEWQAVLLGILPDLIQVFFILIFALVGYRIVRLMTRRLEREVEEDDPLAKRIREQRSRTVASLLNNVGFILIVAVTFLMVLSALGFPIGPLIAGAGVIGLAVSFGAQSLVKDIISGSFILLEGQFGIGDVVRIGDTAGLVEKITLRTTTLRDVEGTVHIIPNGEITKVSNLTKTWSRAVLDIGVAYKEDVDRVIGLLRAIGEEMFRDEEWGQILVEEPTVPGVERFGDSAVTIRLMAKTLPLKQWDTARELRRRIKNRFDAEGIEIPFPHVTFYWGAGQAPATGAPTAAHDAAGAPPT
jgi:moderate conductance mechanosensitive channel